MNHQGTKRMETERLVLRPFTIEDAPKMYENWASDPEVTKFLKWPVHSSVEVTRELLTEWVSAYERKEKYEWCLELKESGEPIGSMGAFSINEKVKSIEVGYCIGRSYWHKGMTSEALQAVSAYLLGEVGFQRLEACHDPRNPHSGDVMKKCGFRYEGTRIQADWNNSGICDICLYGLMKNQAVQPSYEIKSQDHAETGYTMRLEQPMQEEMGQPAQTKARQSEQTKTGQPAWTEAEPPHSRANSRITDETIEYVGILAKLELSGEERRQARQDMGRMLDYIDMLNELDTQGVEPMSHIFSVQNVFREDVVENGDGRDALMKNAPAKKDGGLKVPKTVE